jgi:hypothetical protein
MDKVIFVHQSETNKPLDVYYCVNYCYTEYLLPNYTPNSICVTINLFIKKHVYLNLIFLLTKLNNYFLIRLQDLQAKISALNTSKDTLERMCHNSRDEIQDIISKLENISLEVKDVQGEQRVQSKMLSARENQLVSEIFFTANLIS